MCVWLPVSAAGIDGTFAARKTSANRGDRTHSEPVPNRHRVFFNTLYSCTEVKELLLKIKQNIISFTNNLEQMMDLDV